MSDPKSGVERRKAKRRPVLESFSLFVVVPKKGGARLKIHDLSELGVGFNIDIEGEDPDVFPVKQGETLAMRLYLNQTLYVPVSVKVARITESAEGRRVGAEFTERQSPGAKAIGSFVQMLDGIVDVVKFDADPEF